MTFAASNCGTGRVTVSVITPAHNAAPYLAQTIESVTRQTFTDLEHLIIDDGSTDATSEIALRYAARDPRVKLWRQPQRGISSARNRAITESRGSYLALLDSDDLWSPDYLAEQLAILERHPEIAILSANAINMGGALDGEPLLPVGWRRDLRHLSLQRLIEVEDSMSILSVFRRDVIERIGAFDETLYRSEDYDLWLRAAAAGLRIAVNAKPLGFYRRRPDSLSADEAVMLQAIKQPLLKLRRNCASEPELISTIDAQLARVARRELVADARSALVQGDMPVLESHFSALAAATGSMRYRIAGWLTRRAPGAIQSAYRCKQSVHRLMRGPRRAWQSTMLRRADALRRVMQ